MKTVKRGDLVAAAKDLNKVLDLSPPIDVSKGADEIRPQVQEAVKLLTDADAVSDETRSLITQLGESAPAPAAAKPTPKPKENGGAPRAGTAPNKYAGSAAEKTDTALLAGGTWEALGKKLDRPVSVLKAHAKARVKSGKYELEENGDKVKLVRLEAAAAA